MFCAECVPKFNVNTLNKIFNFFFNINACTYYITLYNLKCIYGYTIKFVNFITLIK